VCRWLRIAAGLEGFNNFSAESTQHNPQVKQLNKQLAQQFAAKATACSRSSIQHVQSIITLLYGCRCHSRG
jgi:uncharacterized membrane protein affecting hemolysin expression